MLPPADHLAAPHDGKTTRPRRRRFRCSTWLLPSLGLLLLAAYLSIPPIAVTGSVRHQYQINLLFACIISLINLSIWTYLVFGRARIHDQEPACDRP